MNTDKKQCVLLAELLAAYGLEYAVISPGSRNAPLIMAFNRQGNIRCLSIPDERSAGFFALGMAQQLQKPVALICTSGTAALNYGPAVAEAYYQHIPLIFITADRPVEWTDQQDGQAIRQENMYSNYIGKSITLPVELISDTDFRLCERKISEAFYASLHPSPGPVHINVPLREPLYRQTNEKIQRENIIRKVVPLQLISEESQEELIRAWNSFSGKMIITGLLPPDEKLNHSINRIAEQDDVVVMTETTSNLYGEKLHPCIDRLISGIRNFENYRPDLLVTIGGPLISRKVKALLRANKPAEHWHVSIEEPYIDAYLSLTRSIPVEPLTFFNCILQKSRTVNSGFSHLYQELERKTSQRHHEYVSSLPFSDLYIFRQLFFHIPVDSVVQLGNSTPVRYAQLFRQENPCFHFSNRGTSGIDGCCSTAAGAAFISGKVTTLITGDVGFFYDSNFLWNNHLSKDLKIILINNGGGGIFRFIDGPDTIGEMEPYIETPHELNAGKMAATFGIPYIVCEDRDTLEPALHDLYRASSTPVMLEIKTPRSVNGKVLRNYFEYLKHSI